MASVPREGRPEWYPIAGVVPSGPARQPEARGCGQDDAGFRRQRRSGHRYLYWLDTVVRSGVPGYCSMRVPSRRLARRKDIRVQRLGLCRAKLSPSEIQCPWLTPLSSSVTSQREQGMVLDTRPVLNVLSSLGAILSRQRDFELADRERKLWRLKSAPR